MSGEFVLLIFWGIVVIGFLFHHVITENNIMNRNRKIYEDRFKNTTHEDIQREIDKMLRELLREVERNNAKYKYGNARSSSSRPSPPPPSSPYGESHFKTLGLTTSASEDEVKKAYRKLSFKHHPDKGGSTESFSKITLAKKECLSIISNR